MFTSESLSFFRVLSPSSIFSCTTIASIFAYFKCIVSYCCSRENETWRQYLEQWEAFTCNYVTSSNRLELSPRSFTDVFKKIETTMRANCMSKAFRFLQITAKHQVWPFFTVFLTIKTSAQNISITFLQISVKPHEHRCWRKKLPEKILEEHLAVPRNTAASKIGNSVIPLLWQLWCRCNPNHNKFSSLSNTTVVASFPNLCLWRRSYAQTWEVLTLKNCIEPP